MTYLVVLLLSRRRPCSAADPMYACPEQTNREVAFRGVDELRMAVGGRQLQRPSLIRWIERGARAERDGQLITP